MAIRYIVRRNKPEDLSELKSDLPQLSDQLGQAGDGMRRFIKAPITPLRYYQYTFLTKKTPTNWIWICPQVELVAEDEKGLFELMARLKVPHPSFLSHLTH